jgi:hypothetical protein
MNNFTRFSRGGFEDMINNLSKYVDVNMTSYDSLQEKPAYAGLPARGEDLWKAIDAREKPVGDSFHKARALEHALGKLNVQTSVVPMFAKLSYLKSFHPRDIQKDIGSLSEDHFLEHYVTSVTKKRPPQMYVKSKENEAYTQFYVDPPLTIAATAEAVGKDIMTAKEALKKIKDDPDAENLFRWDDKSAGRTFEGKRAIRHASRIYISRN